MKATDVTQHSLAVPKAASASENPNIGTWKLQSLVYEATAPGQRSSPFATIGFNDHLDQLHLAAPNVRENPQRMFYQIGCSGEPVGLDNRFLDPVSIFTVSRVAQHLT